MNWAPLSRIVLRYIVGGAIMGSQEIGAKLAADPDLVMVGALVIGFMVEAGYALAKRRGWAT